MYNLHVDLHVRETGDEGDSTTFSRTLHRLWLK